MSLEGRGRGLAVGACFNHPASYRPICASHGLPCVPLYCSRNQPLPSFMRDGFTRGVQRALRRHGAAGAADAVRRCFRDSAQVFRQAWSVGEGEPWMWNFAQGAAAQLCTGVPQLMWFSFLIAAPTSGWHADWRATPASRFWAGWRSRRGTAPTSGARRGSPGR